jgi:hypothetical protein
VLGPIKPLGPGNDWGMKRTRRLLVPGRRAAAILFPAIVTLLAAPRAARAGDVQVALAASGAATEWRGDAAVYSSLKIGYRFADVVGVYGLGRLGYASVDTRVLSQVSVGAQGWARVGRTRPYARLGFVHQHEETIDAIPEDGAGALFGVGDAIRHRAGGEGALGVDIELVQRKQLQLFGTVEGYALWLPDPRGPQVYGGGGAGIGLSYSL